MLNDTNIYVTFIQLLKDKMNYWFLSHFHIKNKVDTTILHNTKIPCHQYPWTLITRVERKMKWKNKKNQIKRILTIRKAVRMSQKIVLISTRMMKSMLFHLVVLFVAGYLQIVIDVAITIKKLLGHNYVILFYQVTKTIMY